MPDRERYNPTGLLAVAPEAHGLEFIVGGSAPSVEIPGAAVVTVCGPITYAGWLFDTYEAILGRAREAFAGPAPAVILRLDTPGGDVFGAFDAARELRAMALASGKPLLAWTGSQCCSAGYALASAADEISASDSAVLGSIGVIATSVETTRQDASAGLTFAIVTSGERKADGNPHVQLSESARAAMQRSVDATAAVFFDLVRTHRGARLPAPEALQASALVGAAALNAGLCDRLETWAALCARVASGALPTRAMLSATMPDEKKPEAADEKKPEAPAEEKDAVRAALAKAAGGNDAKARRALKALEAYNKAEDDEQKEGEGEASAAAAGAAAAAEDEKKPEASSAASAAAQSAAASAAAPAAPAGALQSASTVQALSARLAELEARDLAHQVQAFKATRPDIAAATWQTLEAQGLAFAQLQAVVAAIPKTSVHVEPQPTQGAHGGTIGDPLAGYVPNSLSARMGLAPQGKPGVVVDGNVMSFGVPTPTR